MRDVLLLAWHYLTYHKGKTLTLTVCLTVALSLPLTVHWTVELLDREMVQRARATPLVVGTHGSRFDLTLHSLYFHVDAPGTVRQAERHAIDEAEGVTAIPLYVRYQARGHPIVGTTLDYFSFRGIAIERGRPLTMLGDCVVGWRVAQRLGLEPGDRLLSDPENVFDLGGTYPLNMRVAGILERTQTADDHAVFVDLKTAWVIEGIGHGHDDLDARQEDEDEAILERNERRIVASPALRTHTTITPENIDTFHFHGDPADFPLSAIIAVPRDDRARTLMLGRYVGEDATYQALRPLQVIEELMGMVLQIRRLFDVHHLFLLGVTGLFIVLVMMLSLRLRRREVETMFYLGCGRGMIFILQATELSILLVLSAAFAGATSWIIVEAARTWVQTLTA